MTTRTRVQLRIKDTENQRSRSVKVGDSVVLLRLPDKEGDGAWDYTLADVSDFPPAQIVQITHTGAGLRGKQCEIRVQFQTRDKRTHQVVCYPSDIQAYLSKFTIGEEVVVVKQLKPVMVPVGTKGRVIGGDGGFYHVTFTITTFTPPVTVSQDFVPADALTYALKAKAMRCAKKTTPSAVNTATAAAHTFSPLVESLVCHLTPDLFTSFKDHLVEQRLTGIASAPHLQGVLVQFLRAHNAAPSLARSVTIPEKHAVALRQAGASSEDIATFFANHRNCAEMSVKEVVQCFMKEARTCSQTQSPAQASALPR